MLKRKRYILKHNKRIHQPVSHSQVNNRLSLHCFGIKTELTSYPRKINFTLVTWQVIHEHKKQCSETKRYFARQLRTLCRVKNLDIWHTKGFTINCYQTWACDMMFKAGFMRFILSHLIQTSCCDRTSPCELPRSPFNVKVQCLYDNAVTFADVWSIPAYDHSVHCSCLLNLSCFKKVSDPPRTSLIFLQPSSYSELWTPVNSTGTRINASWIIFDGIINIRQATLQVYF